MGKLEIQQQSKKYKTKYFPLKCTIIHPNNSSYK